jgi:rare lipoprotein A
MNQRIWSGLTVTLLTATLGIATSGQAQQTRTTGRDLEGHQSTARVQPAPAAIQSTTEQLPAPSPQVIKVGQLQSREATAAKETVVAKIHAHEKEGHQAATLFVRDIPVLTFLGTQVLPGDGIKMGEAAESQKAAAVEEAASASETTGEIPQTNLALSDRAIESDPVWRATAVAARLNQFNRDNVDARSIAVRWQDECECYSIEVNDEELVQVNETTILPDTTNIPAVDALQATNRLRRLLGNAPPLREIANLPPPPEPKAPEVSLGPIRLQIRGLASWYGPGFHGRRSASGERFNQNALTAAHRSLPFGTRVQVTNLNNGQSVIVRINDRGPFVGGRVIDLSAAAARMLGMMRSGVAPVRLDVLREPQ